MKIKLDENIPARVAEALLRLGHDVQTARDENLAGKPDAALWEAVQAEKRFLITQDLDFADVRRYAPGRHAGLLILRLREPGAKALAAAISALAADLPDWHGCCVIATENKIRIKRP